MNRRRNKKNSRNEILKELYGKKIPVEARKKLKIIMPNYLEERKNETK